MEKLIAVLVAVLNEKHRIQLEKEIADNTEWLEKIQARL